VNKKRNFFKQNRFSFITQSCHATGTLNGLLFEQISLVIEGRPYNFHNSKSFLVLCSSNQKIPYRKHLKKENGSFLYLFPQLLGKVPINLPGTGKSKREIVLLGLWKRFGHASTTDWASCFWGEDFGTNFVTLFPKKRHEILFLLIK
jgi:hypothetical protein